MVMKRSSTFLISVSLILLGLYSLSFAGERKKLDLNFKDGKVSADIYNITLEEIAKDIGQKWGISVELYGGVDKDRLVSAQFQDLPLLESLYRLLRNINFLFIDGDRLYLLGFGESVMKDGTTQVIVEFPSIKDIAKGSGASPLSKETNEPLTKSDRISITVGMVENENRLSGASASRGKSELSIGAIGIAAEIQPSRIADQGTDSKSIGASFTTPIILDAKGQAISAVSSDITYDPNLLANPRVTISGSAKQVGKEVVFNEVRPGLLRVGVVGLNQNLIPDGVTANVTFDVLKEGQISFSNQPTASDPHGNMVSVTFRDGKITAGR